MNRKTLAWFLRLPRYPFIIASKAGEPDASPDEVNSGAIWFVGGVVCLLGLPIFLFLNRTGSFADLSVIAACLICLVTYLLIGVLAFFSQKNTNGNIPWQENGRW